MKEKILIALSDTNLSKVVSESLKKSNYVIEETQNGKEVIEKMKVFKPDLLLIDTIFQNKSGYDILNEKSFDREITKIPVIIISNNGAPIQMKQIPSTPTIKDYIIKTHIEVSEVIEKIEKVFGREIMSINSKIISEGDVRGKILWAEDDRLLSTILAKKIQQAGFVLLKANNGSEVFKILETEIPNIIILDILLPEINGLDVLQKVKTNEKFRKIPVIMLSNLSKQSDIDRAKLLGANKFLVKAAVSLDEIIHEIKQLIK